LQLRAPVDVVASNVAQNCSSEQPAASTGRPVGVAAQASRKSGMPSPSASLTVVIVTMEVDVVEVVVVVVSSHHTPADARQASNASTRHAFLRALTPLRQTPLSVGATPEQAVNGVADRHDAIVAAQRLWHLIASAGVAVPTSPAISIAAMAMEPVVRIIEVCPRARGRQAVTLIRTLAQEVPLRPAKCEEPYTSSTRASTFQSRWSGQPGPGFGGT
jgi:hypothetical protein